MESNIKKTFRQAIKNGTGDAILILQRNPDENFDQEIIEACNHNLAYDPQCEGVRSDYLLEILSLSKNKDMIENNIINNLRLSKVDNWDIAQLFELVKCLAFAGNKEAKKSLYDRYLKNLEAGYEFVESGELVELDGIKGLGYSAEILGRHLRMNSDFWVDDSLIIACTEFYPDSEPEKFLFEKSKTNDDIKTYLESIAETKESIAQRESPPEVTYESISALISRGKSVPAYAGRKLSHDDLVRFSIDFENDRNKEGYESYLKIFSRIKYPGNIEYIIKFLNSSNSRVVFYAASVLSKEKNSAIRFVIDNNGIEFLKDKVTLFVNNYNEQDTVLLLNIFACLENEDDIHSFIGDAIKVFENNTIQNPSILFNKLYRSNHCSICRQAMIKVLMSAKDISEEILQELLYDSELEIRELAKNYEREV